MDQPTFEYEVSIKVIMDGVYIGDIKHVEGGFQYFPKGSKHGGEVFPSIAKVKESLESY